MLKHSNVSDRQNGTQGMTMYKIILAISFVALLSACAPAATPEPPTGTAAPTDTSAPTATLTPAPTNTKPPTNTPAPTATPRPTRTPLPTKTPTDVPTPIVLTGRGDQVVETGKPDNQAMIAWSVYNGRSNFIVTAYNANGERIGSLVNAIGAYDGKVPLDWLKNENTTRLEVKSSGDWTITLLPLSKVRVEEFGRITGAGDDVIAFSDNIDLVSVDASKAQSNFVIWAWSDTDRDLLINDIAPYTGSAIAQPGAFILTIEADGPWVLGVTKRQ